MTALPPRAPGLADLPDDVLLRVCDFASPPALLALSRTSRAWAAFCLREVWPRRIATCLGVRAVHLLPALPPPPPPAHRVCRRRVRAADACFGILRTLTACPSARTLCVRVAVAPRDTLTALALRYAVSRQDICAANALYAEHHVAARRHLYIPLPTDRHVEVVTGKPARAHTPVMVRDLALSNKLFPVV